MNKINMLQTIGFSISLTILACCSAQAASSQNSERELFDIADQAYIVSWDFKDPKYQYPRRSEELEIDDLFFDRFMVPMEDGSYMLSTMPTTGQGMIGLQWYSKRRIDQLYIEFANPERIPPKEQVKLEYWVGGSIFEGQWVSLPGELVKEAKGLRYVITDTNCRAVTEGTAKVRWYFDKAIPSYIFTKLQALTQLPWKITTLQIELEEPIKNPVPIQLNNAQLISPQSETNAIQLPPLKKSTLKLKYCLHGKHISERSTITFDLSDYPFAVAIKDVLDNGCVYVRDLGVFVTTADSGITLDQYKKQIQSQQTTLEKVRQMPDQSFDNVMSKAHPAIQNNGPAMLSLACDNNKFVLRQDGSIRYLVNLEAPPTHRKSERGHRDEFRRDIIEVIPYFGSLTPSFNLYREWPWFTAEKYPGQTRSLEDSYYPAPLNTIPTDGVTYKQKTFVAPSGNPLPNDTTGYYNTQPLLVSKFSIENTSDQTKPVSLKLKLINDIRTNAAPEIRTINGGFAAVNAHQLLAFIETAGLKKLSSRLSDSTIIIEGQLPAQSSNSCIVYIPTWDVDIQNISFGDDSKLFSKMKNYWDSFLTKGADIQIPDPQLNNLIKASMINCTITARNECNHTNIAPWVSAAHFGIMESESQSIIEGMSLMGHEQFAQNGLDFFIRRYNNDGMLTSGYTLMGMGWHLRVLGQHFQLYRNDSWLRANESKISSACDWIVKQHEKTKMLTPSGQKVLEYGLMPPGTSADWPLLMYGIRPQAEFYAGLNAAAKALAEIQNPQSGNFLHKAENLQNDIISSYRRTQRRCPAVPLPTGVYVPYCPTVATQFTTIADTFGPGLAVKDVSMGAQHLVVLGILPPDAKDGYFKADRFEDVFFKSPTADFPAEKIRDDWLSYTGFYRGQPYYPRITDVYALNDDVKPFIRSYFNNIMPIVNTEVLTFWEHFRASGGWNKTHETGWFLQQTRMMLVDEKDNDLWLAPFVTNHWMQDGMKLAAKNMPTRFGNISFEINSQIAKGIIEADIITPKRSQPNSIILRLRHPQQKQMKSVTVNGKTYKDFDPVKETIRLNAHLPHISVKAQY
ncbi:MAG: hypothetical protein A2Y12_01040 [Planctomycetes bacterium GWF2_42_9]|nr:MAG: hypothetical protein A2Y12_01040 [Planctomycetes bacterium GWF2_42_9]